MPVAEMIAELRETEYQSATDAYAALVARIADGGTIDGEALQTLVRAGKGGPDLERDVEWLKERREWAAAVEAGRGVDPTDANAEVRRLKLAKQQELQRIETDYDAKIKAAQSEVFSLGNLVRAAQQAEANLWRSAPAELHQRYRKLDADRERIRLGSLKAAEDHVKTLKATIGLPAGHPTDKSFAAHAEQAAEELPTAEARVTAIRDQLAALSAEQDSLRRKALEPWPAGSLGCNE